MNSIKTTFLALLMISCGFASNLFGQAHPIWSANMPLPFTNSNTTTTPKVQPAKAGSAELLISHGHCALPYSGDIEKVNTRFRMPEMTDLEIDFELASASFEAGGGDSDKWTRMLHAKESFDAAHYPTVSFVTEEFERENEHGGKLKGKLKIRNVQLPVTFDVTSVFEGSGRQKLIKNFFLEGKVNLHDYGIYTELGGPPTPEGRVMTIRLNIKADAC